MSQTPPPLTNDLYYDSPFNGFRILLPEGWVIEDHDSAIDPSVIEPETYFRFGELARICPENIAALPGIGGTHQRQVEKVASPDIIIIQFTELKSNPQFASVTVKTKLSLQLMYYHFTPKQLKPLPVSLAAVPI
jgi:hypothetical protein